MQRPNQCPPGPSLSAQNVLWSATRLFRLTRCMHLITFPHPCCNPHPLEKQTTLRVPKQEEQRAGKVLASPLRPKTNSKQTKQWPVHLTFSFQSTRNRTNQRHSSSRGSHTAQSIQRGTTKEEIESRSISFQPPASRTPMIRTPNKQHNNTREGRLKLRPYQD